MRMRKKPNLIPRLEACGALIVQNPMEHRGRWRELLPGCREVRVELGCGKGRFTVGTAQAEPDVLFVAVERVPDAMVVAAERAKELGLANTYFIDADAADLEDYFAPGEVGRIYINFCDPWPGARYAKRRLTHPGFLLKDRKVLCEGGQIHFKSDNHDLFEWSLFQFPKAGFVLSEVTRDLHADGPVGVMTDYEEKFYLEGKPINRCVGTMTELPPQPQEPDEEGRMRHNHYDDPDFFDRYAQMTRSKDGLAGAGEWWQLKPLFPPLKGKRVLDLGCGYGWHCRYAADQGAREVLGLDLSEKMIAQACQRNAHPAITYRAMALEEYDYPEGRWDCVVSNLTLHYIANLEDVYRKVRRTLTPGGIFLFNIEHPVFTAGVGQDWIYDEEGKPLCWPVDDYFLPGERRTHFLGSEVVKQHHTLTQLLMGLLDNGFVLEAVEEARPSEEMAPLMPDELRRPMMLLVRARTN